MNGVQRLLILTQDGHDSSLLKRRVEQSGYAPEVFTDVDACVRTLARYPSCVCMVCQADCDDRARVVAECIAEHGLDTQLVCLVADDSNWGLSVVPSFCCEILDEHSSLRCLKTVLKALHRSRSANPTRGQADSTSTYSVVLAGRSSAISLVRRSVAATLTLDGHLLITGPEGVGKNLLARQIHVDRETPENDLVYIDCRRNPLAQLSDVFDSLTPHSQPTGQTALNGSDRRSDVNGTLILDQVDQLPRTLQRKLARVLRAQDRLTTAGRGMCGSSRRFRVISLSTQPLRQYAAQNVFDHNLYGILAEQLIDLPALSARAEDIEELVREFFRNSIVREGQGACQLSSSALEMLCRYDWPGNLRELWNVLSHAACMTEEPFITSDGVASWLSEQNGPTAGRTITLRQMERMLIESTFARCGGNREDTARSLGIGLRTLSGKLRDYGYPPRGGPGSNQLSPRLKVA